MQTLSEIIAAAIEKYHRGVMQKKVLKTVEEIEANTDSAEKYIAGVGVVAEINNNLKGFTPILDSTGKITGYKTKVGADTVFPFFDKGTVKCKIDIHFWESEISVYSSILVGDEVIGRNTSSIVGYATPTSYGYGNTYTISFGGDNS